MKRFWKFINQHVKTEHCRSVFLFVSTVAGLMASFALVAALSFFLYAGSGVYINPLNTVSAACLAGIVFGYFRSLLFLFRQD